MSFLVNRQLIGHLLVWCPRQIDKRQDCLLDNLDEPVGNGSFWRSTPRRISNVVAIAMLDNDERIAVPSFAAGYRSRHNILADCNIKLYATPRFNPAQKSSVGYPYVLGG